EHPLLRVQGLAPTPRLRGQIAQTPQGTEVVATPLQDLPEVGGGFVVAAQTTRFLCVLEQLEGRRVVGLGTPTRAGLEEALEGQAERQERTDRDGQRHGRGDAWKRPRAGAAARRTISPWPSVPLPRSPAGSRCSDGRTAGPRAVSRQSARCTARTTRRRHRRASGGPKRRRGGADGRRCR